MSSAVLSLIRRLRQLPFRTALTVDGEQFEINVDDIDKAHVVPQF